LLLLLAFLFGALNLFSKRFDANAEAAHLRLQLRDALLVKRLLIPDVFERALLLCAQR
jgi:hypothetical protein